MLYPGQCQSGESIYTYDEMKWTLREAYPMMQIKAAILNRPLQRLNMTEAVSLGAALLGGMGAGLFKNLEEALGGLKYGAETIEPDPATMEIYQAHYKQIYTPAWQLLQPMQERLQQLYPVSLD